MVGLQAFPQRTAWNCCLDFDVGFRFFRGFITVRITNIFCSDLSYAAWQYERIGYITNSMIIVNILHAFYVVDFFINEDWLVLFIRLFVTSANIYPL